MNTPELADLKVFPAGNQLVVHVPLGWGEALRVHLESHGIHALVSPPAETSYERVEVEGDVDAATLQTIVNEWSV